ncbi:MAG: hypothetical protein JWQ81_8483 [Amycolatopsis sp.]|nr:hypothetical protein [Amycolatopsis sp.]
MIALSHDEQYSRLAQEVPQALSSAAVVGDPCFDRLLVSADQRANYRAALGARDDTSIIAVSSTWGNDSLFGQHPDLISELLAELHIDDRIVVAILHPNTWFAHGPAQIHLWLGDCLRAGLRLIPPDQGWQQAVLAADVCVGDHGAVTGYAAAAGIPTMLATFAADDVVAGSAIDAVGRTADYLDCRQPLGPQVNAALAQPAADRFAAVRDLTTSAPGQSAQLLRTVFYQLMDLPEPDRAALVPQFPAAELLPHREPVRAWWAETRWSGDQDVRLNRWPADVVAHRDAAPNTVNRHLVVASSHPRRDLYSTAAIVILDPPASTASEKKNRVEDIFRDRPTCQLVVTATRDARWEVTHRDGHAVSLIVRDAPTTEADFIACVSVIHGWLARGRKWSTLPATLRVALGHHDLDLDVVDTSVSTA